MEETSKKTIEDQIKMIDSLTEENKAKDKIINKITENSLNLKLKCDEMEEWISKSTEYCLLRIKNKY